MRGKADNGRQAKYGYDVIVGGELFTDYSDHPRKLVTLNPKLKSTGAGRYQLLSRWWDAYRKQLGLKDFSPKVRTLWHCSRLRSVALYLWLIVVISVRQSTVAAISGLHCRALVMVSSSIRLTAWLQNSKKRAERSERLMYEQSHRDYLPLWLSASSSACHGLLIITVITPLPTKLARQKCQRTEAGERGGTDIQMRQRDVAALDAKYTKELAL